MAVSLRYEVGAPWAPENDEGEWGDDEDDQDDAEEQDDENGDTNSDANGKDNTDNGDDGDAGAKEEKKSEDDDDGKDDEKEAEPARNLRYGAWIERNRKYVEEQTNGRVGYIYVPNTGRNGQNDLVRQLFGQIDKQALIDGGGVTAPTFAFYENDGTWGVEGHGVDPDIEVIDDSALMIDGGDPQLDKAIEPMLAELRRNPHVAPKRPTYPDRSGMSVTDADK